MTVKTDNYQVGSSGTASQNFTLRTGNDGTLKVSRGEPGATTSDVMLVNADDSVSFPGGVVDGVLGAGQTWQNVLASRAATVTYTNTTGRPIQVSICASCSSATTIGLRLTVDGLETAYAQGLYPNSAGPRVFVTAVVPDGSTYSCAINGSGPSLTHWTELR